MEQKKKKTNNNYSSSQTLLDHCYTFGLLLWPSNSEEVVLWRRALIDLLWPCPGSTTVRYKCAGVMSTPKCLYLIAMHSVCCCSIPLWRRSSLEKGPLIDVLWPCSGSAPRRILPKSEYKLEWGFPNGTKYPPRQPIPNRAILPNRARVYRRTDRRTDGRTDGQGDSSIPPP